MSAAAGTPSGSKKPAPWLVSLGRFAIVVIAIAAVLVLYFWWTTYVSLKENVLLFIDNFYWLAGKPSRFISVLIASAFTGHLALGIKKTMLGSAKPKDYSFVLVYLTLFCLNLYYNRHRFFREGHAQLFICSPAHPDDRASIETEDVGASQGRRCALITPDNVSIAHAIDRNKAPSRIRVSSRSELNGMTWYSDGTARIYYGSRIDEFGIPTLFSGPGFDPDTGGLLKPVDDATIDRIANAIMAREQAFREQQQRQEEERQRQLQETERRARDQENAETQRQIQIYNTLRTTDYVTFVENSKYLFSKGTPQIRYATLISVINRVRKASILSTHGDSMPFEIEFKSLDPENGRLTASSYSHFYQGRITKDGILLEGRTEDGSYPYSIVINMPTGPEITGEMVYKKASGLFSVETVREPILVMLL